MRELFADLVFATERGGPFTPNAVNRLVKRIGARTRGHDTRRIQDWLGHRSIQHTTGRRRPVQRGYGWVR